jgi:hypothetical protein
VARTCIFCGSTDKLSAEHVFPDWSQPYLVSPYGPGTHQRQILRADGNNDKWSHEGDPATATVRTVCEPCNNGWMSRLESSAQPYLLTMIKGHGRTYYPDSQKLLAAWAVKTALVSGSKFKPPTPESFYRDFYAAQEPPENTVSVCSIEAARRGDDCEACQ